MTSSLTLHYGDLRCDIKPALGGCIAGLWMGDVPVLRSTPADELHSVRLAGSYPLVPFSNRVSHARLHWQGAAHPLVKNFEPEPHAIHGVGWERPWAVREANDTSAVLSYQHKADAAWPFDFDSAQAFKLSSQALEMSISITNQSQVPAPVGLGWHPYFAKRSDSRIAFSSAGRWDMGDDKLPTQRRDNPGLDLGCATLTVDHCFDGWHGELHLRDALLHTRISANVSHLVIYTKPGLNCVAIEPVSHVNDAINLMARTGATAESLGLQILKPGETFSCAMRIDTERTR